MNISISEARAGILTLVPLCLLTITPEQQIAQATGGSSQLQNISRFAPVFGTVELNGCRISPR